MTGSSSTSSPGPTAIFGRVPRADGRDLSELRILKQALDDIPDGPILARQEEYQFKVPAGEAYRAVENPKGELGYYVVTDGTANPYRYHVRGPSFINLTSLEKMCIGHKLADAVVILGAIDIVLGEVDR